MNQLIKILSVLALIAVIIASVTYIIRSNTERSVAPSVTDSAPIVSSPPNPDAGGDPSVSEPSEPQHGGLIEVKEDDPLQPKYEPINQPAVLQNLRQEGKIYCSSAVGKVSGRARKKDWGFDGSATFEYLYAMKTTGKILKNDGHTVVEERFFDNVEDTLIVSDADVRVAMPAEKLGGIVGFIATCRSYFLTRDETIAQKTGEEAAEYATAALSLFNKFHFHYTNEELRKMAKKEGFFIDKVKATIKAIGLPNATLLKGKRVKLTFKDGLGLVTIEPMGCTLSDEEVDIIKRTNFVMDHYLMPETKKNVGDEWKVDGSVFSGFMDPRLQGKIVGSLTVERIADFPGADGQVCKRLRLRDGNISVENPNADNMIVGKYMQITGSANIPSRDGVVTGAALQGYADYKNVSKNHLLFEARMEVQPLFEIKYECVVKDQK